MNNRTMVKIIEYDNQYAIRTVSRENHSSRNFYIKKNEVETMMEKGSCLTKDLYSYAELWYDKTDQETADRFRITFYWIEMLEDETFTGRRETVVIPSDSFNFSSCKEGKVKKVLTIPDKFPVIEFNSRHNLHRVAENKRLRKKLGRFLTKCFKWKSCERIVLYDYSSPYDFFFESHSKRGEGLCGGIILFGENNLKTAHYTMHT